MNAPQFYTTETTKGALLEATTLRASEQKLQSWMDLATPLAASRSYVATRDADEVAVARGDFSITWKDIDCALDLLEKLLPRLDKEPTLLATHFRWIELTDGADFSGYYEPLFNASKKRDDQHRYPIYKIPHDLQQIDLGQFRPEYIGQRLVYRKDHDKLVPYYSRAEIDNKALLDQRGLELAWLADRLDVYFLQMQGSGRLRFTDGSEMSVAYAGTNGRSYFSIGRYLENMGYISGNVSMQSIREWLKHHPNEQKEILQKNERYTFFRQSKNRTPIGSMNRELTPWVSLAVDRSVIPLGIPVIFAVDLPRAGSEKAKNMHGIGFAQDAGGALLGRRVDLFCGSGDDAAYTAGRLNGPGQIWMLLPKE